MRTNVSLAILLSMTIYVSFSCSGILTCVGKTRINLDVKENEITYNYGDTLSLDIDLVNPTDSTITIPINEGCFWIDRYDSGTVSENDLYNRSRFHNILVTMSDSLLSFDPGERKRIRLDFVEEIRLSQYDVKITIGTYQLVYACAQLCEGGFVAYLGDSDKKLRIKTIYY